MAAAATTAPPEDEKVNDWRVLTACVRGFHATLDLVLAMKAVVTASVVRLIEHDAPVRKSAGFIFHGTCVARHIPFTRSWHTLDEGSSQWALVMRDLPAVDPRCAFGLPQREVLCMCG